MADFPPNSSDDADTIASVFGFDDAPGETLSSSEPGAGVVAPSPAPEPPAAAPAPAAPAPIPPLTTEPVPTAPSVGGPPTPAAPEATPPSAAPATPPTAATPAAAPAAPPTQEQLELAALRATVQALQAEKAQTPTPPATVPDTTGTNGEAPIEYALTVPPELSAAIFSEDPAIATQGITVLVQSLAQTIHSRVRQEFQQVLTARDTAQQEQQQTTQRQQAATQMQSDYYTQFPAHDNPTVKQIVAQQAAQIATEYPNLPWGPDYMNAIGARVNAAIAALTGAPAPAELPAAPAPPAPPTKPAPFAPSGTRGAVPTGDGTEADLIASTFSFDD